jgi:hypothetical protein
MATGDARQKLEIWRYDDKPERPHGAAGNKPPTLLKISVAQPARTRNKKRKFQLRTVQKICSRRICSKAKYQEGSLFMEQTNCKVKYRQVH